MPMTPRERFLAAARRQSVDSTPIWMMGQAGAWLPEHRASASGNGLMDLARDPMIAAELTCQPIRRFGFDAAMMFSDILVPAQAMGLSARIHAGHGPSLAPVVRDRAGVEALAPFDPDEKTGFLASAIRLVRSEIGPDRAIVGCCGAPFTMASHMIEGASTPDAIKTKALLAKDPELFLELLARITEATIPYLAMQVEAGADVLQIVDPLGCAVDHTTYATHVLPHLSRLVCVAKAMSVPVILYANHASHLTDLLVDAGPDVLSLETKAPVREILERWGTKLAFQGNLDPDALLGTPDAATDATQRVLDAFATADGHIFNLGSECPAEARLDCVQAVVDAVRRGSAAR